MIRIFLFLSAVFGVVLYRFPAKSYSPPPALSVGCTDLLSQDRFQTLHYEKESPVLYSAARRTVLESDRLYFVPAEGKGFFEYQKIGKEIAYFVSPDEAYWRRETGSYPVSDSQGRWLLLQSGDLTAVRLMDHNGNIAAGEPLSGLLLTDYVFDENRMAAAEPANSESETADRSGSDSLSAALLFASGPVYVIRFEPQFRLMKLSIPKAKNYFAKSIALSRDRVAIHLQEGNNDFIRIYSLVGEDEAQASSTESKVWLKEIESVPLSQLVPHRMPMALTENGVVFTTESGIGRIIDGELVTTIVATDGVLAGTPSSMLFLTEPDSTEYKEMLQPRFQGAVLSLQESGLTVAGSNQVLSVFIDDQLVAASFQKQQPFRLLPNHQSITIEDKNSYCTIAPSASR